MARKKNRSCFIDRQCEKKNRKLMDELKAQYQAAVDSSPRDCRHCARNSADIDSLVCGTCGPERRYFMPKVRK